MGRLTRGERNIHWIEAHCIVPEGKDVGKPVKLRVFQKDIIKGIYDNPTRRAIISFGRKNAKTTLSAFLLLLHLCGPEARRNSQLYSAAQSRDQASILFSLAAKMVRFSQDLSAYVSVRDTAKQLYCEELGTLYRALSAEASTAYGLSPVFVVHDELGQVRGPRSDLYDALETASGAQEHPLSIIISTQAPTDGDLLSILIDDAKLGEDPKTKLFLYSASEDLDPFSEEAQRQANPALGDFLNPDEVSETAAAAKRMPAREAAYRNLVLNQRVNMNSPFIPQSAWKACEGELDESALEIVFAGIDLSSKNDLSALLLAGRDDHLVWHVRAEFFAPSEGLMDRSHRDRVPYDLWAKQGFITLTPGASIDYSFIADRLKTLAEEKEIRAVAFDRWRMDVLEAELTRLDVELPLEKHGQGYAGMSPALEVLEGELMNQKIRHDGNPVLTWCAANAITLQDPAGNRKLDKSKSTGRIDGIVALAMAIHVGTKCAEEKGDINEFIRAPLVA